MAENNRPMVVRPRILTNSAAEFVENRIDSALGIDFSERTEFVPELDRFELTDEINRVDYYAESKKRIKLFEQTLERFSQTLEKHDLAKKMDITLKKPNEYTLTDVIRIADKVYEKHKTAADVQSCTGVIRKCFRFVGQNASPLQCLLKFVPNDPHGSIIYGGFTVILAAAERVESLRESIYAALEAIPEKLRVVGALSDIHYKSPRLYFAADSVFLCLFKVLDKIVEELTRNIAKKGFKAVIKGKIYGQEIDDALQGLEGALSNFKQEADICNQQRLGRLEDHMISACQSLARLEENQQEKSKLEALDSKPRRSGEGRDKRGHASAEIRKKETHLGVLNMAYKLFTSSKSFDCRTGRARGPDYLLIQDNDRPVLISSRPITPEPSPQLNKKALKKWSARLSLDFLATAERDMRDSLRHNLHRTQQDQVQYIMTSEELLSWLEKAESGLLFIQCETAPRTMVNAMSLSSAFLAQSLRQNHHGPVLYHSCGLRTEEGPRTAERSGTIAVINSLNSQLATHLQNHTDLSFLGTDRYRGKSQTRLRSALKLLWLLMDEVPEDESVFVIIDSLSRLSGDAENEVEAISGISRLADQSADKVRPTVKVLMTDLLPDHVRHGAAEGDELLVPDRIDAGGQGLNTEYLREVSEASIGRFEARRRRGASAWDSGNSSEESGSSGSGPGDSEDDSGSSGGELREVSEQSGSSDSDTDTSDGGSE